MDPALASVLAHHGVTAYRCLPDGRLESLADGAGLFADHTPNGSPATTGRSLGELARPEEGAGLKRARSEALDARREYELTYRLRGAPVDGRWVPESGTGVYADDGRPVALTGLIREVAAERRLETALAASEDRYRRLLASVSGIVKQSGGNVWVYSEVGQGTTVKVCLPQDRATVTTGREPVEGAALISGASETVLVAEDEEAIRSLTEDILRGCGYTVMSAANGREAEKLLAEHPEPIQLLITEVVMPRMSGRELAEPAARLRPGIAILHVSGYTDEAVGLHGVAARTGLFLQKPFTARELTLKAREAIEARLPLRPADGGEP